MPLPLEKKRHRSTLVIAEHDSYDPLPHFEMLARSLKDYFPVSAKKIPGSDNAPPQVPRMVFASKNSQLYLFPNMLQFQVEYFGNFEFDPSLGSDYCRRKINATLDLLKAHAQVAGLSFIGVVHTFHISSGGLDFRPTPEIAKAFLLPSVLKHASNPVDMELRIGLPWREQYFLNYTFKNYRTIAAQLELTAGPRDSSLDVSMSDPAQTDEGIQITVDLNTKLLATRSPKKPVLLASDFDALIQSALEAIQTDLHARFGEIG